VLAVPAAIAGAWALAAPGISGHAGDPGRGPLVIGLDALHVAAAAIWIGGLVQLAVVTPHATRGLTQPLRDATRARIAGRFSRMAVAAVAVLAVTGALRALWELSAVSQIWTTSYGRTLLAKTVLLLMTLAVASRSRRFLGRYQMLRRSVTAELVVLSAVVAAVALLTNLPPGSRPTAVSGATTATGGAATVALRKRRADQRLAGDGRAQRDPAVAACTDHSSQPAPAAGGRHTGAREADRDRAPHLAGLGAGARRGRGLGSGDGGRQVLVDLARHRGGGAQRGGAAGPAGDRPAGSRRGGGPGGRGTTDRQPPRPIHGAGSGRIRVAGRCRHANGRLATPCLKTPEVCFEAPVGRRAGPLAVTVLRPGRATVGATLALPAADAHPAAALVRDTARSLRALHSVRFENHLASDSRAFGGHDVHRGCARPAGDRRARWRAVTRDRQPPLGSSERQLGEAADPAAEAADPYWANGALAAYVTGSTRNAVEVTLGVAQGPTFFRLLIDKRTHLVKRLWMTTAAHFMREHYLDFNSAPPVTVPPS
jgi:uncharacterized membrane protein